MSLVPMQGRAGSVENIPRSERWQGEAGRENVVEFPKLPEFQHMNPQYPPGP